MKLSYRIPISETSPKLDVKRDDRGITIIVAPLRKLSTRMHSVVSYVAGVAVVLLVNAAIALAVADELCAAMSLPRQKAQ